MTGAQGQGRGRFATAVGVTAVGTLALTLVSAPAGAIVAFVVAAQIGTRHAASAEVGMRRLRRALAVHRAMRRGEIVMHYQPKVSLATGDIVGAEALARWAHPRRGLLSPAEWIDATELPILEWRFLRHTLDATLAQARAWHADGEHPIPVCVNVTPRCFADRRFLSELRTALDRAGATGEELQIELTEAALDLSASAIETAGRLEEMGVGLALDDFGVGHSSMSRVARLPMTELKIDRQFVSRQGESPRDAAIVRAAVGLADELGVEVTAEGIETFEQARALSDSGCHVAQGFYFAAALPATEFEAWIGSWAERRQKACPERRRRPDRRGGQRRATAPV